MKMKRYSAPDMRQAISMVRDELGPDAVILSNRSTDDGVELIAAIDYDEAIFNQSPSEIHAAAQAATAVTAKPAGKSSVKTSAKTPTANSTSATTVTAPQSKAAKPANSPLTKSNTNSNNVKAPPIEAKAALSRKTAKAEAAPETQVSQEWLAAFRAKFAPEEQSTEKSPEANIAEPKAVANGSSDKELKGLRSELNHLRDLLENQLSSLTWQDVSKRHPQRAKVLKLLFEMGITPAMSRRIVENITFTDDFPAVWRKVLTELTHRIPVASYDIVQKGGVFALVGPTGVGKTTTIAKMAARFALNHGTKGIALITTDNYRIGAQEQLRTYGRILGAPVRVVNDATDLRKTLKSLYDKQLILIDTAGMSQRDVRLAEQFAMLSEGSSLIKTYLVMSAAAQAQVLEETVAAYKKAVLDGCIISKIDESSTIGGALATVINHQLSVAYASDGQRVPEDLHAASAVDLVKRAVDTLKNDENKFDNDTLELMAGGLVANGSI